MTGRLVSFRKKVMTIKTLVSWMGNKTSILHIIYALFPKSYTRYIEPFGGSGAVLLGKSVPDKFEVYNDYNANLVNLFRCIKNTVLDSDSNGSGTELEDILETIEKQQYVDPVLLKKHFWEMFAVDALLGNFDRHNGNWGFLYDSKEKKREIAPVYDCGSCLLPQADDTVMHAVLNDKDALNLRIYRFPTSAIKLNGNKINYYDFLSDAKYEDCNQAVRNIYERTDMDKISAFIDGVPYISDLQKEFYKRYIEARLDVLLRPVFEMTELTETEQTGPTISL